MKKTTDVAVVGGGLAVAALLARGGKRVTLFEKSKHLGGRAHTTEVEGYQLNLGPHALYLGGAVVRVLRSLGVPMKGRIVQGPGRFALPAVVVGWHDSRPGRANKAVIRADTDAEGRITDVHLVQASRKLAGLGPTG
ncbi:NAD(P)-binding protein [Archangium violaceum]|uniref:NAD(P)-binding protein n=1 Tax=Archangium violaceum TaxID=83451 RepID=UPI002B2C4A26|nr:NAD(P)-binding protein [Archangium violaceum]